MAVYVQIRCARQPLVPNLTFALMGYLLPLFFTLLALSGCANQGSKADAREATSDDLEEAPNFALPTMDGNTLQLTDLRGEVVILNFWATWCVPCVKEIPDLIALHNDLKADGLTVVGVSLDTEDISFVKAYLDERNVTYPNVLDADGEVADAFGGIFAVPTTFVIDHKGHIVHRSLGLFPVETMRPLLKELLKDASA